MNQKFPQSSPEAQSPPLFIPQYETDSDDHGSISSYQPNGKTNTNASPFFSNLGTNGRTCFTCHQPQNGWGLSVDDAASRFAADPSDPLFRLVDGATCPSDHVSTPDEMAAAYSLLTSKGLIRIGLPILQTFNFTIQVLSDTPGGCNDQNSTGPAPGTLSFYRRPLPSTNLGFITGIMWDTREPSLFNQAADATLGHAQAASVPTTPQINQIVSFEGCNFAADSKDCNIITPGEGVFTAQSADNDAGDLTDSGATGGPVNLYQNMNNFILGTNDPFAKSFNPAVFDTYDAWSKLTGVDPQTQARLALYRGEQVFNNLAFKIKGVPGLNDVQGKGVITGTCSTCHNNPNVGNHSSNMTVDIGVTGASPPNLDVSGLPVFSVQCNDPKFNKGQPLIVTDLGVGMVTGQCADIGKTKIPIIRGIAGRSPYFHNGSAPEITNLIDFYNDRFNIGLTDQEKADLAVFLESL
jgi:hypothetical protein